MPVDHAIVSTASLVVAGVAGTENVGGECGIDGRYGRVSIALC